MDLDLLILGASVRAAAQSAAAAGCRVFAGDLFADRDLVFCSALAGMIADYPHDLAVLAEGYRPKFWLYTGGLENYPDLVDSISRRHALLGNAAAVLRRVRDPLLVAEVLSQADWPHLPVLRSAAEIPPGEIWMRKPLRGSGGEQVTPWPPRTKNECELGRENSPAPSSNYYFQKQALGTPCSALYVAASGNARLLGVSEQLLGEPWCGRAPFMYAGSVGPLTLSPKLRQQFTHLGNLLAESFALVGLFGVDAVIDQNQAWLVEINPRYTASAEIHELARGASIIGQHIEACRHGTLPDAISEYVGLPWGKAVWFAPRALRVPEELIRQLEQENKRQSSRRWADLPQLNQSFQAGQPVLTVLTQGATFAEVKQRLLEEFARLNPLCPDDT